jgi:hypothetical protein
VNKLIFEVMGIQVELRDHLVDVLDMALQVLFAVTDLLVPEHSQESLDELLGGQDV